MAQAELLADDYKVVMEVMGVFSSWDTLDTKSCLEASRILMRASSALKASMI